MTGVTAVLAPLALPRALLGVGGDEVQLRCAAQETLHHGAVHPGVRAAARSPHFEFCEAGCRGVADGLQQGVGDHGAQMQLTELGEPR